MRGAGLSAATPTAHASLKHTFSVIGANTVEITFNETEVKLAGGLGGWLDSLPQFTLPQLPESLQVGTVEPAAGRWLQQQRAGVPRGRWQRAAAHAASTQAPVVCHHAVMRAAAQAPALCTL